MERIVRVRGGILEKYGGVIKALEFTTQYGKVCKIGSGEINSFDISYKGYHLNYLSGNLHNWRPWAWHGKVKVVNGLTFVWAFQSPIQSNK